MTDGALVSRRQARAILATLVLVVGCSPAPTADAHDVVVGTKRLSR